MELIELASIRKIRKDRGQMLNFSKLETLANELIQARVLGLFSDEANRLDDILEAVDFNIRIRLLKKMGYNRS